MGSNVRWDEPEYLRGELYTEEHLIAHAVELGKAHGTPQLSRTAGPLRARFAAARKRIDEAYRILGREARHRREPTPAEEWLLDNASVVEAQLREITEDLPLGYLLKLPRLASGAMQGHPRVYALCVDYLRHSDARIDFNTLAAFVQAYQRGFPLTIGELWAVPIMLRLGLTLGVGALAVSEASAEDRARGDAWAHRLLDGAASPAQTGALLRELEQSRQALTPAFLVQLLHRLREHDAPPDLARDWLNARAADLGTTSDELARREHLRQAADQVSVGNAITSMRAIAAYDWDAFFERTCEVEQLLRQDPGAAYAESDKPTRDRYRHAVEALARRGRLDERAVTRRVLELCKTAQSAPRAQPVRAHVGYHLIDEGLEELEHGIGYRCPSGTRIVRTLLAHPLAFYFGTLGLFTGALIAAGAAAWCQALPIDARLPLFLILFAFPASEIALALTSSLVVTICPPRLLPGLNFERGIPPEHRTLVAVPVLIDGSASIDRLLEELEVRSLANPDPNLFFALVTDHTDASTEAREGDAELVERMTDGIRALNARHGGLQPRYWLFHRRRIFNPNQGRFMGWERKRGKLAELNRLLSGDADTSFSVVTAPRELLASVRYVITLDADTELPRDCARKLVAKLAHPLNRPEVDAERQRIVRGHAIIQPRVGTLPLSARRSRFAAITAGPPGIDPYTTAVSDVYQDLFGEGSFVGKGIYDVAAVERVMAGRIPENRLLSHDLFEGIYGRAALATDVEVLDEQPHTYDVQVGRLHRWVRGDWQLLPWLLPRIPTVGGSRPNDLSALDAWKIVDNLRRSLLAPSLVLLVVWSLLLHAHLAGAVAMAVFGVFVVPTCARLLLEFVRESSQPSRSFLGSLGGDLRANARQLLLNLVFTLDQAYVDLDAILRTSWRLAKGQRLLEWTTMQQSTEAGTSSRVTRRLVIESAACVALGSWMFLHQLQSLPLGAPLLLLWALAPWAARWLSQPPHAADPFAGVSDADRLLFRRTACKTWRYFDTFVTASDHQLPPDNYQEDPRGELARRTSPTNIGLYLLSVVSARELGFIGTADAVQRIGETLDTIERLEKREGHLLNWYDTASLQPLEPRYVSTVDSGNLAAYLWTLGEACEDLGTSPLLRRADLEAIGDALRLAVEEFERSPSRPETPELLELQAQLPELGRTLETTGTLPISALSEARRLLVGTRARVGVQPPNDAAQYWLGRAELGLERAEQTARELSPLPETPSQASPLLARPDLSELSRQLRSCLEAVRTPRDAAAVRLRANELVSALETAIAAAPLTAADRDLAERELDACQRHYEHSADTATEILGELLELGARARALADGMSFGFLFDAQRELFSIGYNVTSARLDPSHYDLLASEARLGSLWCIAKGDVPERHWFRMGRPQAALPEGRVLLSWSGSMFEYLMPLLLLRSNPQTLLDDGCRAAVERQRRYGSERGVPWGISESAYNVMDLRMTYQYRAFGVPGLGIKAGLDEELAVAPYATVLAGLVRPDLVAKNLRALANEGLDGPYGFYESIDYTAKHVPPGRRGVVVKTFMAHHQGMSLVAIDSMLNDAPMQRRFHRHPRIKAAELLLEERVPARSPLFDAPIPQMPRPTPGEGPLDVVEHIGLTSPGPLRAHLLGHGELSSIITASGGGVTTWKGLDVNRFREDPLLGTGGIYLYLRNRSTGELWSAAYQPTRATPDYYNASFAIDRVEFHRQDREVQTVTEIALSPEHAAEVRRVTLTNHGSQALTLELTSYSEVVLASRGADVGHPAFGKLFVETEALPERNALLAQRRPRGSEPHVWMLQMLTGEDEEWGPLDYDTSRAGFLGRGGGAQAPAALEPSHSSLGRQVGKVLDPALVLRRSVRLEPGASARITLTTALASTREEALGLVETYTGHQSAARAFELGWAGVRVELRHLGITATEVQRFQRLLSAVLFPHPSLRVAAPPGGSSTRGKNALWAQGVSGDLPIVLLRLDHTEFSELCHDVLLAHDFWRLNGFACDLVIFNEEPSSYLQTTHDNVRDLMHQSRVDQRGGVFLRRADQMSEEERQLLACAARVVLRASEGSLGRQLRRAMNPVTRPALLPIASAPLAANAPTASATPSSAGSANIGTKRPELSMDNGLGGFDGEGREYVIVLEPGLRTPAPWCNVMANPSFGTLVSEAGSSFTWTQNSQRYRLTPWSNDPVSDPSGELIYVRDDATGAVWSPTPGPAGAATRYVVRHGAGYTRFEHQTPGLEQELTIFVSARDPVKLSRLQLRNTGTAKRRLSIFGIVEWVLGGSREDTRVSVSTAWEADVRGLLAMNPLSPFPAQRAFFTATVPSTSHSADREEIFGVNGSRQLPQGLRQQQLSGKVGAGLDPCAALHVTLEIEPGESALVTFVLGHGDSVDQARAFVTQYGVPAQTERCFEEMQRGWEEILEAVQVKTPDPALDMLENRWLLYQTLSARLWARTGFYQSSGAFGFRDQLQDVLATLHAKPEVARAHLLRCAARQFVEGDVQHWWHEETGEGLRTRCSDDMLWLPYVTAEYVRCTGDRAVLDEVVPFLRERTLSPGEEDLFSVPAVADARATLYEHCTRALEVGATSGPHELPTMRGGDWNDGMNRVGQHGQGESIWLAWFLARTLLDFSPFAVARDDKSRASWCRRELARLAKAVEKHGWDGDWYRRAYFDDGSVLGSHENSECSIDAIAQSWAVIAGIGDRGRARRALAASESMLIDEDHRLMCLLTPPFEHSTPDPGYIQAYPAGIRENGGQYTHGVLWTVHALALEQEGDRAFALLSLLNPIHHGSNGQDLQQYRVEPYVLAGDVYSVAEHAGRGGWTWYTGSAGWMYRIILEQILGVQRRGKTLSLVPCIPSAWNSFEITYRYASATYHIRVDNPQHVSSGVTRLEMDGQLLRERYLRLADDGAEHEVRVTLGHVEQQALRPA